VRLTEIKVPQEEDSTRMESPWAVSNNNPTPIEMYSSTSNRTSKSWGKPRSFRSELLLLKDTTKHQLIQAELMLEWPTRISILEDKQVRM